ncbi:hypothetical protein [Streptomyces sp. NPDC050560]|uniref:hypothetical protein n=1 Tax=Streptomyces sp. NPDC050560 TaxID=3365630 RepID=UPI00379295E3
MAVEAGASARARALAVLRVRGWALGAALLPAAVAVVLLAGGATGHIEGDTWDSARWAVTAFAALVLLAAAGVALVVARARPAVSPTVVLAEKSAPDLYRLVRDLADRLGVPAPSGIALTPDCDSWLEDRTHPAHGTPRHPRSAHRPPEAPVLVIGSPFLWWMRVAELRAVLAPVVAGTGPSAHPDIAAARRFIRGLDAALAVASTPGRGRLTGAGLRAVGWVARTLLRGCRVHAGEMERAVAAAAADRAQSVDFGLRIVAQEQVGLAYAGWDRLLTRVALPAWRMGRWPSRLDAGVVAALTELSRRDRLAENFAARLGERPACDLLEEPGAVDEAASLLAARIFHGGPARPGPDWAPVDWAAYPDEVVDRKWRADAARLHRVLDGLAPDGATGGHGGAGSPPAPVLGYAGAHARGGTAPPARAHGFGPAASHADSAVGALAPTLTRVMEHLAGAPEPETVGPHIPDADGDEPEGPGAALAAGLSAELAREEAAAPDESAGVTEAGGPQDGAPAWDGDGLPLLPAQPPRTGRELLVDHVTAMVCCAAVDTAGATPGLDWLDGPALLVDGERAADLAPRVHSLVDEGDPEPLRGWLTRLGVRPEKPVRLA